MHQGSAPQGLCERRASRHDGPTCRRPSGCRGQNPGSVLRLKPPAAERMATDNRCNVESLRQGHGWQHSGPVGKKERWVRAVRARGGKWTLMSWKKRWMTTMVLNICSSIRTFMDSCKKLHQFPVMISIYKWTYQRFLVYWVWAFRFLSVLRAVSIDGILWHQIRGQRLHDPVSLLSWLGTVQMFYSLNDNKHKCQQH